jgi:hypothetical protein
MSEQPPLRARVEAIMRMPIFVRSSIARVHEAWSMLVCPRCNREVMVDYGEWKRWNRDRVLIPCLYCHAFSRRPGMTALKVKAILKRKAKQELQ